MKTTAHLILVAGYPGSGKTFVALSLARLIFNAVYLDKDTITSPLAEELLSALGQPIQDRESPVYQEAVRPFEYECLMTTAIDNIELGKHVIASAPFLQEITNSFWTKNLESHAAERGFTVKYVWVKSDALFIKKNLTERGAYRDEYKLKHWESYKATLNEPTPKGLPSTALIFDNSHSAKGSVAERVEELGKTLQLLS